MKKYSIGIDIGTNSVGWAVVNPDTYKIVRKGNKSLWGVRLFEEGQSAVGRRGFRSSRRRYDRRRQRIKLLQDEFKEEINKVDTKFFRKLETSFYSPRDLNNQKEILSKEEIILLKRYYQEFPTIYHLRNHLMNSEKQEDIRLIYLAIHHIIKYRGNFLYDNDNFKIENLNIKEKLKEIFDSIDLLCNEIDIDTSTIDYSKLEEVLLNKSKSDRKQLTKEYLGNIISTNIASEFGTMIVGNKFSVNKLFNLENNEDLKISFSGSDYEDNYDKLEKLLNEKIETLDLMKQLYDMLFLENLFKNSKCTNISSLMIEKYDQHKEDLKYLKAILKADLKLYKKMFKNNNKEKDKSKKLCIYEKYVTNNLTYDEFISELNKFLPNIWEKLDNQALKDKYTLEIDNKIKNGNFLPRITDKDNGKFPFQLNKQELELIIEKQGKYYPFLKEKVNKDYKLIKLLEFRIPYYVGPLVSSKYSQFAWMERKQENIKITPYNFDEVVDTGATAEKFILRMIGTCTYLNKEPAMPANSILYNEFKVLNELKQIKVNGDKLTNEMIQKIIQEFFRKNTGVLNDKKFKQYLNSLNEFSMYEGNLTITGYSSEGKFANNMQTYIDFFGENGFFKDTNLNINDAENIIKWITIFEDKEILKNKIKKEYPILKDIVDKIVKKRYKGWSNLSLKLLTDIYYYDEETSLNKSIMNLMNETEENFMQIINNKKYNFEDLIAKYNIDKNNVNKINYDLVKDLATSPATKRGIYQSLLVIKEITDYMGYDPINISIEMARGDEKKQRTVDRKKYLQTIYKAHKNTITDYKNINNELNSTQKIDSEKLYLYFIQEGKSLYSHIPLDINKLSEYEVDHIIPRSLYKDDSIENKALVLKEENQSKGANLVLPFSFRQNKEWWSHLKDIGLISSKKFYNLCRKEYSEEDINGFINRQIVETRQITKHVANIVKNFYKNTNVIYLPASLSHNYRIKNHLYKFRDLNDYHHAHDAYLACVLGEYKNKYFKGKIDMTKLKEISKYLYNSKRYNELSYGYVINSIDEEFIKFDNNTGEVLFEPKYFMETVENTLYRNDILISKKTEIKTGEFYKQTIYGTESGKAKINLKKNLDYRIYGGYTSYNYSYMMLIKYKNKKKDENALIGIPVLIINQPNMYEQIDQYIKESLNCDKYEVLKDKIPFNITMNYKNQLCSITGCGIKSAEIVNDIQFQLNKQEQIKYKNLLNLVFNDKYPSKEDFIVQNNNTKEFQNSDEFHLCCDEIFNEQINELFELIINKIDNHYPLYKNINEKLKLVEEKNIFKNLMLKTEKNEKNISKIYVIQELFKMLKCNSTNANLKNLPGDVSFDDRVGRISGANIKSATIIHKSVTGLKEYKDEF